MLISVYLYKVNHLAQNEPYFSAHILFISASAVLFAYFEHFFFQFFQKKPTKIKEAMKTPLQQKKKKR